MNLRDIVGQFGVEATRVRLLTPGSSGNAHWAVTSAKGRFVLRRYNKGGALGRPLESCLWEHALTTDLARLGYPAAAAIAAPREIDGEIYAVFPFLRGKIWDPPRDSADYRKLGRLLAAYHAVAAKLPPRDQRPNRFLFAHGALPPTGGVKKRSVLLERLAGLNADLARQCEAASDAIEPRLAASGVREQPLIPIHCDFSFWNLAFENDALSCVFDWDLAHMDCRASDLAFSRRGYHDDVVRGYREVAAIRDEEIAVLDALWIGSMLGGLWRALEHEGDPSPDWLNWTSEQLTKTRPYRD